MIHSEVIATIARRLPHRTRRDVTEIIELMVELWSDELLRGHTVTIPDIGQLKLEIQDIQTGGILKLGNGLFKQAHFFISDSRVVFRFEIRIVRRVDFLESELIAELAHIK
jgi:nucleoid DNA-binding protein